MIYYKFDVYGFCAEGFVSSLLQCINTRGCYFSRAQNCLISIALEKKGGGESLLLLILAYVELAAQMKHNLSVATNVRRNLLKHTPLKCFRHKIKVSLKSPITTTHTHTHTLTEQTESRFNLKL